MEEAPSLQPPQEEGKLEMTLSIVVPKVGCQKDCPFCISRMTGRRQYHPAKYWSSIRKIPSEWSVDDTTIIVTARGEPLLNIPHVQKITQILGDYQLELQTNGLALAKNTGLAAKLWLIDTWAISVRNLTEAMETARPAFEAMGAGSKKRLVLALTDEVHVPFQGWIDFCLEESIDEFTIRAVQKAPDTENEWIDQNVGGQSHKWINDFPARNRWRNGGLFANVAGISVVFFPQCLERYGDTIILDEDGKYHDSWIANKPAVVDGE